MEGIWILLLAGACITAYRGTGRHIVALEGNKDIFDAILKPNYEEVSGGDTNRGTNTRRSRRSGGHARGGSQIHSQRQIQ